MICIIADVNIGYNLIIQFGDFAQELLLNFLLCDINGIKKRYDVAVFRILVEPEIRSSPERAAILPFPKKLELKICFPGGKAFQHIFSLQGGAEAAAIAGI